MSEMSRERLLEVVRHVYDARDPMPEGLVERMQDAAAAEVSGLGLDLELMLLVEQLEGASVRGESATRRAAGTAYTLRFTLGEVDLLVRVAPGEGDGSRVDGWIAPAEEMTVRVLAADQPSRATAVAETGRFEFAGLPQGLLRLRFEPQDLSRPPFATPTFEI
ncbi:hypothetical protein [Nocardioides insulae]|uniref:hypothetical protein n=1 Tax=Nocardioides insulae TaxID=394734 RepID=UPI000412E852|nr:hypothetical protein [Nocardioides insulae]